MLQGFLDCVLCDLVEGDPADFLAALLQLQRLGQVPADRFTFAVRVRCEEDLIRFLDFLAEFCQNISLSPDRDVLWLVVMLHIDPQLGFREVADMAVARIHHIGRAEEFFYGLHLCRRLNNNKF